MRPGITSFRPIVALFRLFQDCEKTLDPGIADLFEREANNFARFALFQGDRYAGMAADHKLAQRRR